MRTVLLVLVGSSISLPCLGQHLDVKSATYGACSPVISNVSGSIVIRFSGTACAGMDPAAIQKLNEFLAAFPKTQRRLQELLDKKDVELSGALKEATEWAQRYRDLSRRLDEEASASTLSQQAASLLHDGQLERAAALLDELLGRGEREVGRIAMDHFNRGQAYELQQRSADALKHYEKAYQYRPDNVTFCLSYGRLLLITKDTSKALVIFGEAVDRARASLDPMHPDDLFNAITNLALASNSAAMLDEALVLAERAMQNNPSYIGYLHNALGNKGTLLSLEGKKEQARSVQLKALEVAKQAAAADLRSLFLVRSSTQSLINTAFELHNYYDAMVLAREMLEFCKQRLGNDLEGLRCQHDAYTEVGKAYEAQFDLSSAETAFVEVNRIVRVLAAQDMVGWQLSLESSLDRLGDLRFRLGRFSDAESAYLEALSLSRVTTQGMRRDGDVSLANQLKHLGNLYEALGKFDRAEQLYEEMLVHTRKAEKKGVFSTEILADRMLTLANVRILLGLDGRSVCELLSEAARIGREEDLVRYSQSLYMIRCSRPAR
jgi:tetratricopeptide (TPR) repeat protein